MIECVKICEQGFSHSHEIPEKICQDAASVVQKKGYTIISVADGHGGERYFRSDVGSKIAVKVAEEEFEKLLVDISKRGFKDGKINWEQTIKSLESNIVQEWQNRVEADFQNQTPLEKERGLIEKLDIKFDKNFEEDKKQEEICNVKMHNSEILKCYGTTLLTALYIPILKLNLKKTSFYISLQIGDGLTFALDENNEDFHPIPEDESLGFGITTSLCSSNAVENFRHSFGFKKLNALVLCSDGVADSFARDKFGDFVRKIQRNIKEHGRGTVQKELQEFFPKLSEQGSGDDVSLAGVFEAEEK